MKKLLALVLLLGSFTTAQADTISLDTPGYGGTGCPAGSASVTLSPDNKSLSVLFDSYVANAGGMTGKTIDRKTCNLSVPVHVPQGIQISIFKVDYRGYVNVPFGGEGRFNVEYFFAGTRGPSVQKTFPGGYDRDYFLTNDIITSSVVWSPCGEDVNLRINSGMLVKTNRSFADAMASVDSIDIHAGIVYHVQWRSCR
ncbi:MAG: DUF4360 domain-containing protein [Oligoflexia bacterium]|nr:DUF4360 domain-containing protein [Oligoflexia bacterium]